MVWSLVAVGVIGTILGVALRGGALIMATISTVVVAIMAESCGSASVSHMLFFTLALVVVLQCSYLFGLAIGSMWRRSSSDMR